MLKILFFGLMIAKSTISKPF